MIRSKKISTAIFILDESLGSPRLIPDGKSINIAGIDLWPSSERALNELKRAGVRLVLGTFEQFPKQSLHVLQKFLPFIDSIVPLLHDFQDALPSCAKELSIDLSQTVFVAADRMWRSIAADLGCTAVPHPLLAALVAKKCALQFVRATGDREQFDRLAEVVPYSWERRDDGSWCLLAVMSRATIAEAIKRRLEIEVLPLDISREDPLFVQVNNINDRDKEEVTKQKVLLSEAHRILLAVGSSVFNDALSIRGAHGTFQHLMPSPKLFDPAPFPSFDFQKARLVWSKWPLDRIKVTRIQIDPEMLDMDLTLRPSTAGSFQADVDRYCGASSLDSSGAIASRHIRHPDNQRIVQALVNELNAMGYCAYTNHFTHAGMTLENVIADLPGTGYFRIVPDIIQCIREIFIEYPFPVPDLPDPFPDPKDLWIKRITQLLGTKWIKEQHFNELSPRQLRTALERVFYLLPWFPWWLKSYGVPGLGAEIVLVGCHLDSTATGDAGYNPFIDPSPGADDDASGIAAVLAIARYLSAFKGKMTHTIRFCFFNAEEQGLVGSNSYAAMLKATGAPVKAVVCMDMMGYNSDAARIFEIHAGYSDPVVRDLSVPIADSIAAWAASIGSLAPAQVYKGTSSVSGADRNLYDGAIDRSDHASFHQQGYPATVVSEDYFVNMANEPGADPNPNYHTSNDKLIDSSYASDITCAVAFAIKELARG